MTAVYDIILYAVTMHIQPSFLLHFLYLRKIDRGFPFLKSKIYQKAKYFWIFSKWKRKGVHVEFFEFMFGKKSGFPWDNFTSIVSRYFGKALQEHLERVAWGNNLLLKEHGDWEGPCCPDEPLLFKFYTQHQFRLHPRICREMTRSNLVRLKRKHVWKKAVFCHVQTILLLDFLPVT